MNKNEYKWGNYLLLNLWDTLKVSNTNRDYKQQNPDSQGFKEYQIIIKFKIKIKKETQRCRQIQFKNKKRERLAKPLNVSFLVNLTRTHKHRQISLCTIRAAKKANNIFTVLRRSFIAIL